MLNILITLIIPVVILMRFSGEDELGPARGLVLALAFPIGYAIYEIWKQRKVSWTPIVGVVSVLLTGGIALLELPPDLIAIKEASIPLILALAILFSAWMGKPLARVFLSQMLDREKVEAALRERGTYDEYEQRTARATYMLASAFLLSAALNYGLAKVVVTSDPGTEAFNSELGRMTALSFPVITIPVFVVLFITIFYVLRIVNQLTGLEAEEVVRQKGKESAPTTTQNRTQET
ncbi:MAG TPA: VC0807 family protein [Thermomicrobiales bacterium]|nr:VC0807 family protein [Thermomicrobiales bacterium]